MYYGVDKELDQLEHHGILGQKWGVRRFQRADGTRTAEGKKREKLVSSDELKELSAYESARYKYDDSGKKVKKTLKNMSNEELKEASERYDLEKKYKESQNSFREKNSKMSTIGGKIVGSVLLTSGLVLMKNALSETPKSGEQFRNEVLLSAGTVAITVLAADKGLKTG